MMKFNGLKLGKQKPFDAIMIAQKMVEMGKNWATSIKHMDQYEPKFTREKRWPVMVRKSDYSPSALKNAWKIPVNLKTMIQQLSQDERKLVFAEVIKMDHEARSQVRELDSWNCPAGDVMRGCHVVMMFKVDVEKEELRQQQDGMMM